LIARDQKALEQVAREVEGLAALFPLDVADAPAIFAAADAVVKGAAAMCGSMTPR
jgi:hypothetical protein